MNLPDSITEFKKCLMQSYPNVFKENKYDIQTLNVPPAELKASSGKHIQLKPYRTPYALTNELESQIQNLLAH